MPLSRSARHALNLWLIDRAAHPYAPADVAEGPLWLSRTGGALSARSINTVVAAAMDAALIDETAHALRHTLATRLVRDHRRDLVLVADVPRPPRRQDDRTLRALQDARPARRARGS